MVTFISPSVLEGTDFTRVLAELERSAEPEEQGEVTEGSAVEVQGVEEFQAAEEEEEQEGAQEVQEEDEEQEGAQEVQEEEELSVRTPASRRRVRLQSHGTPAGGLMLDLGLSGTVTRYSILHYTTLHYSILYYTTL